MWRSRFARIKTPIPPAQSTSRLSYVPQTFRDSSNMFGRWILLSRYPPPHPKIYNYIDYDWSILKVKTLDLKRFSLWMSINYQLSLNLHAFRSTFNISIPKRNGLGCSLRGSFFIVSTSVYNNYSMRKMQSL